MGRVYFQKNFTVIAPPPLHFSWVGSILYSINLLPAPSHVVNARVALLLCLFFYIVIILNLAK